MNYITGKCYFSESSAEGFNVLGNFCNFHKDLFVRDWSKQKLNDLFAEFSELDEVKLKELFDSYKY